MRYFLITFALLLTFEYSNAQKKQYVNFFKEGNSFLEEQNYSSALASFLKAYQIDSSNANINFKIGYCYTEIPQKKILAEKYFLKAITDVTKKYKEENPKFKQAPYYTFFYYAELLHVINRLEESKKMFKAYEAYLDKSKTKEETQLLNHYKEMVDFAEERESHPVRISIKNLGDSINSPFSEYSPVSDGEEKILIFTYRGDRSTGASEGILTENGKFYEDIFISQRLDNGVWSKARPIDPNINSKEHDASVSLSYDGKTLIVYRDDEGDGNLYYSERTENRWSELKKFGPEINSKYWEPSACFSADQSVFYFVSDRPGGFGGRDIYRCRKLPNGEWSKAENLGSKINTKYDEDSPFLHSNGKDFYFSSNGHNSMGGFDIMVSEIGDNDEYGEIFALPYPINTTEDDLFYFVSGDGKRAYYSSSHSDSLAKGESDIYEVSLQELNRKDRVFARGGFVIDSLMGPDDSLFVTIYHAPTNSVIGKYKPNKKGEFVAQLSLDSLYTIKYFQNSKKIKEELVNFDNKKNIGKFGHEIALEKVRLLPKSFFTVSLLNLTVLDEQKSPVKSATVVLSDSLKTQSFKTDSVGKIIGITLLNQATHKLTVTKGDVTSSELITTNSTNTTFEKIVTISSQKSITNNQNNLINESTNTTINNTLLDFSSLRGKSLREKANFLKLIELVKKINPKNIQYKVQVAAYRKPENYKWNHLKEFGTPEQLKLEDGITRFTFGLFDHPEDVYLLQQKIITKGQKDAWVTAVYKGKRYTLEELIKLDFFIKSEF